MQYGARALVNLLDLASRELKIRATAREELLNITDDALFDYHLVFMQGRNSFRFTDAEREQLKKYIDAGEWCLPIRFALAGRLRNRSCGKWTLCSRKTSWSAYRRTIRF